MKAIYKGDEEFRNLTTGQSYEIVRQDSDTITVINNLKHKVTLPKNQFNIL